MIDPRSVGVPIGKVVAGNGAAVTHALDQVAVEEPLEIRLAYGPLDNRTIKSVAITMRTPGEDFELAIGFLYAEGILRHKGDVEQVVYCGPETGNLRLHNVVRVELRPTVELDLSRLERHFYMTSSCGVCGKTSIEAIKTACDAVLTDGFSITAEVIHALPEFLRSAQSVFDRTGGLHAAALFDRNGRLQAMREDVGRHNAVDKLVGLQLLAETLLARERVLLVSGRASFELVQKVVMAGIPVMAAVGAPSSLAVDLARQFNVTLLGFVRDNRFNIYNGPERIQRGTAAAAPV